MSEAVVLPSSAPAEPKPAYQLCTQPDCTELATFSFLWGWGEAGYCCTKHQFLLQQAASNMKQNISFAALAPQAPLPMTRDERVQLHALRLTLEDELRDAKGRTSLLYNENQTLVAECKRLRTVNSELEAGLRELSSDGQRLLAERDNVLVELGGLKDELARLRTLCDALEGAKPDTIDAPFEEG